MYKYQNLAIGSKQTVADQDFPGFTLVVARLTEKLNFLLIVPMNAYVERRHARIESGLAFHMDRK